MDALDYKRVLDIYIERCRRRGTRLQVIAAIVDRQVIIYILAHLGLPARAAPRAPLPPLHGTP